MTGAIMHQFGSLFAANPIAARYDHDDVGVGAHKFLNFIGRFTVENQDLGRYVAGALNHLGNVCERGFRLGSDIVLKPRFDTHPETHDRNIQYVNEANTHAKQLRHARADAGRDHRIA